MRALRRLLPAVVSVCLLAGVAGCDWPAGTRYVDRVFADTDATIDVVYRHTTTFDGQPIDLTLDIYQPQGDTAAERPAVIWMFGGGWTRGSKEQMAPYARDSALRGYVGITINYRIRPDATGTSVIDAAYDAYDDAVAAAQWVEAHAADYRVDPDVIVAAGYSAGAVNALNLAYLPPRTVETSPVDAAVAIAGLSFAAPSPGDPRVLMHHGTADTVVPYSNAQTTCNEANAIGDVCRFYSYEGAGHEIGVTESATIMLRTADFIYELVMLPAGYPLPT